MTRSNLDILWQTARRLNARARRGKGLPPLLFFTDPIRTHDIAAVMRRLPKGAGVVWRPFGAPGAVEEGRALAALARERGLVFLVGADPTLARQVRADGLHLPERLARRAAELKRRHPKWLITAAAHSRQAILMAEAADAVVLSPVFPSRSPSAGAPIGLVRLASWVRRGANPGYALGGVNAHTSRRLLSTGAVGIAAIEGLL